MNIFPSGDIQDIAQILASLKIFRQLDAAAVYVVAQKMTRRQLSAGEVLFRQGEAADAFYILTAGVLQASISNLDGNSVFLNTLNAGECIGEIALLTGQPRTAAVTALQDSQLLCLTRSAFEQLAEQYPSLLNGLADELLPRFLQDQTRAALKNFFGEIDDDVLRIMLRELDCVRCHNGEVLFRQGDPGNAMYIIIQGRLRSVLQEPNGSERILSEAGAGECVGEFALLAGDGAAESCRTATVYATRLTDMVVITRPVFESLLEKHPQALLALTRKIVQRAVAVSKLNAVKHNMVIALLPAQVGQSLEDFTMQFAAALSTLGPTLSLNAERFESLYGKRGIADTPVNHPLSAVINAWLDEREREHAHTIYDVAPALDSEGRLTAWAQRCLEDADLILLVGKENDSCQPSAIEHALSATHTCARMELALMHPADCPHPNGTADWLVARSAGDFPIRAYHHVRMGNTADFRRLARRVIGKPVGIAFSGGSARGWAHLGVLRALEEAGIEFDWVAGASMGSIVAAGCALDWSSQQLGSLAARFSNSQQLLDYTFPYAAFTSTRHISSLLKDLYPGSIEDTWKPFFCISANLTQIKEVMHTNGSLWKAVRASMAFPGIFAPVMDDNGDVLLDGGAANNLPVDRMREVCPTGTVIGVDLLTGSSVNGEYCFGDSLSGWQALMGRLSKFGTVKAPHLFSIMAGLVEGVCHYRLNEVRGAADFLIEVPVQKYGLLDFDKYAEIIEAGYVAAREQLVNAFKTG